MDLGFTEEQLATLMEGYKAMNGDASANDIVADLGIQDYVDVTDGQLTAKPVEPAVNLPSLEDTLQGNVEVNAATADAQTPSNTTTEAPVAQVDVQATTGTIPDVAPTTTPETGTTSTQTTPATPAPDTKNDFGIPDINYVPENPSEEVDVDLSKVGDDTETTPTPTPTPTTTPTTGGNSTSPRTGSNNTRPVSGGNRPTPTGTNTGGSSATTRPSTTTSGGTSNSTELDVEAVKNHIKNNLKPDFTNMKKACNDFAYNIMDLQYWFYGPAEADCTSAYKAIKQDYGTESEKGKGIVGSIRSAFDWVDYCDQYISQWEKEQKSGNLWV